MRQQEIQDMLHEKQYLEDLERKEYLDDQISKIRYQQQLDEQLKIREQDKINIYKQFLKEKEQIDEVVRKIKRENEEKIVIQMEQKLATKQQIEEFKKSQIVWREIEERKILEENEQIKKFIELKESRDSEFSRIQKERRQIKNESVLRLADDIRKQQDIEREREEILYELNHGRKMEEERFKEQLEEEENIKRKLLLKEANDLALKYRRDMEDREKEIDEKYRQMMLDKFAEDDRIEQMNAQRRRMKKEEHKRSVQILLEERRRKRQEEKMNKMEELREQQNEDRERNQIIEEERMRILQENIEKLVGHIPKGILSEEDIDALGGRLKTIYSKKGPSDPLLELEKKYSVF